MLNRSTEAAKWYSVIGISIGTAIFGADVTIVNTALPIIQKELVTTTLQVQWMMNIFALLMCVLMPTMGRLSDL